MLHESEISSNITFPQPELCVEAPVGNYPLATRREQGKAAHANTRREMTDGQNMAIGFTGWVKVLLPEKTDRWIDR